MLGLVALILLSLPGGACKLKVQALVVPNRVIVYSTTHPETFDLQCPYSPNFFVRRIDVWYSSDVNYPRLKKIRITCNTDELSGLEADVLTGGWSYRFFLNPPGISGLRLYGFNINYFLGMQVLAELSDSTHLDKFVYAYPEHATVYTFTTESYTEGSLGLSATTPFWNVDLFCPDGMVISGIYGNTLGLIDYLAGFTVFGIYCEYIECDLACTAGSPTYAACTAGLGRGGCSCPKGYGKSPLRSACTQCPIGTYKGSYLDGNTCKACTLGGGALGAVYSGAIGLTSDSCAYECKAGYEKPGVDICTKCSPGNYKSTIGNSPCVACTAGTFASISGKTVCTACTSGSTYQEQAGQSACLPCSTTRPLAGYYLGVCTTTTHSQPISCGLTTCGRGYRRSHDCPLLTSSLRRAPPTCVYCAVGTYQGASNSLLTTVSLVCLVWFHVY